MNDLNLNELHQVKELLSLIESNANFINANLDKLNVIFKGENTLINNHILTFKHYKSGLEKLVKHLH